MISLQRRARERDQSARPFGITGCDAMRIASGMTAGLVAVLFAGASAQAASQPGEAARALVRSALSAQGGEERLRALRSISWHAEGFRNELEQSERPEGPWLVERESVDEIHDLAGGRLRSVVHAAASPFPPFDSGVLADEKAAVRIAAGAMSPGNARMLAAARESLALSPERVLLTALDSADLRLGKPTTLLSVPQDVLSFTLDGAPVVLFLNRFTHLPTAIDYSGPLARSGYWAFLGDVTMRTYLGFWWLAKDGLRVPLQRNVERNGSSDTVLTIDRLEVDGQLDEGLLAMPGDLRARFDARAEAGDLDRLPLGDPARPPVDLGPGITLIPGRWNVTLVRQSDGIVIIEAPIASGYSAKVIDEAMRRYPQLPIKAVVTTSDSWPHLAGIREYAARGVPIYCLDLNAPILRRIAAASYSSKPDAEARAKRAPDLRLVSGRIVIGSDENRVELIPIRGETSERQMMAWFPARRLLYGSDPFQKDGRGRYFYAQTVSELKAAAAREKLAPEQFIMMHIGPSPWTELDRPIAEAMANGGPALLEP